MKNIIFWSLLFLSSVQCQSQTISKMSDFIPEVVKEESQWLDELGSEKFRILREKGTEYPHTGKYNKHFKEGTYSCSGCGAELFKSSSKFDAHCGWPSFDKEVKEGAITEIRDISGGMVRTEILCTKCGGHLGHVFEDGPTETNLRYCVNSLSLSFDSIDE
ncbi:MAG: Peptide methionine sulfoxide reductase MsrB [Owenweeksia sp. TMED14]|nr:MAG: Peptide methionine sulfoxide reductase MsrB [Owenweeksia sp. TMED14]